MKPRYTHRLTAVTIKAQPSPTVKTQSDHRRLRFYRRRLHSYHRHLRFYCRRLHFYHRRLRFYHRCLHHSMYIATMVYTVSTPAIRLILAMPPEEMEGARMSSDLYDTLHGTTFLPRERYHQYLTYVIFFPYAWHVQLNAKTNQMETPPTRHTSIRHKPYPCRYSLPIQTQQVV